ncbi:MAG: hypothetical protein KC457_27125 [Myxococcales bacterium]|nr:hypothetical protein [Myxococcales bacterium]
MSEANRWLHLRHPDGFSDEMFAMFAAHCRIWQAYTKAVLAEWATLEPGHPRTPSYVFFEPTRDGNIVTLPVGGDYTLGSRATFENAASHLLSDFFPIHFRIGLEEGLTETTDLSRGPATNWRPVMPVPERE